MLALGGRIAIENGDGKLAVARLQKAVGLRPGFSGGASEPVPGVRHGGAEGGRSEQIGEGKDAKRRRRNLLI